MNKILGVIFLLIVITGCKQYSFTFNDATVYEPPTLFTDYSVTDAALGKCLSQTISEFKVYKAEDLKILRCGNAGITRIEGLNKFAHITVLDLSNNKLKYLPELAGFSHLNQLNLSGNSELSCTITAKLAGHVAQLTLPAHCDK